MGFNSYVFYCFQEAVFNKLVYKKKINCEKTNFFIWVCVNDNLLHFTCVFSYLICIICIFSVSKLKMAVSVFCDLTRAKMLGAVFLINATFKCVQIWHVQYSGIGLDNLRAIFLKKMSLSMKTTHFSVFSPKMRHFSTFCGPHKKNETKIAKNGSAILQIVKNETEGKKLH